MVELAVDLKTKGARTLFEHWVHGEGAAKIRWGTEGSMDRCIRHLTGKVRDPGGLCAEYHHAATGEWPRGGTIPSSADLIGFAIWQGLLAPIEKPTGDGREFGPGSLTHRQLPLPLMWQREMMSGRHDGAVIIGSINEMATSSDQIYGRGELFNPAEIGLPRLAEDIEEVKFLLSKKVIGPSVDLDKVTFEWRNGHQYILEGRICSATLVPVPAFAEARPFELYEEGFLIASSGVVSYPFEFISLQEWKSSKHPRDYHGRFRETPDAPDVPARSHVPRHRAETPPSRKTPPAGQTQERIKAAEEKKKQEEELRRQQLYDEQGEHLPFGTLFAKREKETKKLLKRAYKEKVPYEVYQVLQERFDQDVPSMAEIEEFKKYLDNRKGKPLEMLDEDRDIIEYLDPGRGEGDSDPGSDIDLDAELKAIRSEQEKRVFEAGRERAKLKTEEEVREFDKKFVKDNPDIFPPGAGPSILSVVDKIFKETHKAARDKEQRKHILSGPSAADEDFAKHIQSGAHRVSFFSEGMQGQTALVRFADGTHAVHKRFPDENKYNFGSAIDQADAEELASEVGRALGVTAPAVFRSEYGAIFMEYMPGQVADDLSAPERKKVADTDDGRLMGLMDLLIENNDRHELNWLFERDESGAIKPKAIDHGLSFRYRTDPSDAPELYGDFSQHFADPIRREWRPVNDMSPEDMAILRERLQKLLPRFQDMNREDWHEALMTRLGEVEKRARGTKRRVLA